MQIFKISFKLGILLGLASSLSKGKFFPFYVFPMGCDFYYYKNLFLIIILKS